MRSSPALVFISSTNTFIYRAKRVNPQYKKRSSLAINMCVCSVICIWRWVAKTSSLLAINSFVCSVKSYSEVSSRDYLITNDKHIHLLVGSWFRHHQKEQKVFEIFLEKTSSRDGHVKMTETRQGWENPRTPPTMEWWWPPLWPPKQCICIPSTFTLRRPQEKLE